MTIKFPAVEPFESGLLDVGDGHHVYFECAGNPGGKPALFLHGGPGSGSSVGARGYFDPAVYRAVLFDQRGAGRSRPSASEADADLSTNTTAHLIADIERLREHLEIDRWTVLGGVVGYDARISLRSEAPEASIRTRPSSRTNNFCATHRCSTESREFSSTAATT
jgi:proline iminopeptidase